MSAGAAVLSRQGWGAREGGVGEADVPDGALIAESIAGSKPAFAELVRRHQGRTRGLLLRLCRDRTLADDLAQEVFLRAFRGLAGFEGRSGFGTWLYRISYNVYLNHAARTRRFASLPGDFGAQTAAPEDNCSPRRADLRWDLEAAVAELPPRYRGVVVLYYLEELSYPEIAEVLSLPLGTVKTHLHRAKRLLRSGLGDGPGAHAQPESQGGG